MVANPDIIPIFEFCPCSRGYISCAVIERHEGRKILNMPAPPYRNRRREFTPRVGEKVLVTGRVGMFSVEQIDVDKKTAVLRKMRPNLLVKDVEWVTMFPWESIKEGLPVEIKESIEEDLL